MAWSHGFEDGSRCEASSSKSRANFWYCGGSVTLGWLALAVIARSVERVRTSQSLSNVLRISCFSSSVGASVCAYRVSVKGAVLALTPLVLDLMMMGSVSPNGVASLQLIRGS